MGKSRKWNKYKKNRKWNRCKKSRKWNKLWLCIVKNWINRNQTSKLFNRIIYARCYSLAIWDWK